MLGNRFADGVLDEDSQFEFTIMSNNNELYIDDAVLDYIQEREYMNYLHSFSEEYNTYIEE